MFLAFMLVAQEALIIIRVRYCEIFVRIVIIGVNAVRFVWNLISH